MLENHRDSLPFAVFNRSPGERDPELVQDPDEPLIDLLDLVTFVDAAIVAVSLRPVDEEVQ